MKPAPAVPACAAWYVEVRPASYGSSYHLDARIRVLAWHLEHGRLLPITAFGPVSAKAFAPVNDDPACGLAFVELRGPGERKWWNPLCPEMEIDDAKLKKLMRNLLDDNSSKPKP